MEMKITSRDKVLLSLLACVLIIVGSVWYLIIPMYDKMGELDEKIETEQLKKQEMEMRINAYPEAKKSYQEARTLANQLTADFYDVMTSQEVDRELTNIVVDHALECTKLNIQQMNLADREAYVRSGLVKQQLLEDTLEAAGGSDEASQTGEAAAGEEQQQTEIFVYKVSMTLEGAEEDYQKIIDLFVNNYPSIEVTGITYQEQKAHMVLQDDGSFAEMPGVRELVLNLELYLCDKRLYTVEEETTSAAGVLKGLLQNLGIKTGDDNS